MVPPPLSVLSGQILEMDLPGFIQIAGNYEVSFSSLQTQVRCGADGELHQPELPDGHYRHG